jgi:hypothetical protein
MVESSRTKVAKRCREPSIVRFRRVLHALTQFLKKSKNFTAKTPGLQWRWKRIEPPRLVRVEENKCGELNRQDAKTAKEEEEKERRNINYI